MMKFFPRFFQTHRTRKGMALVTVLGLLVLVLILVVAFLSSVSVELQAAKRYSSGADASALADSAVSLVISQIQDATTTPQLAWASQPGMIRTYRPNGAAAMAYKLYSANPLRVVGAFNPVDSQATEVPADWMSRPALYTDLNKPVAVAGVNHYPIIDASAVAANVSGGTPLAGTLPAIEGSYLNTLNPAVVTSADQTNPVPMPVQWIYVLESGALAAMDPVSGEIADATKDNPVVGRIAFWTDDETSKVNINTASEGTFWDRPWTTGKAPANARTPDGGYERNLAVSMPVQNEFQRYPGHPAMTALSPIFPQLSGETDLEYKNRIYSIIPRVTGGGSEAGTQYVDRVSLPIVPDTDRLFASVDEFLFQPTSEPRQANQKAVGVPFTEADIQRSRFFLTANSRSPEVNLFNKPRITLWPLQANTANVANPSAATERNSKDRLIAFCSTIGNQPFYFQRYNTYTQNPNNPSSQSSIMDWEEIPRNQELYTYLQKLMEWQVPGLGGSLKAKYPETGDQILTQMFDFVRSMVNTFSMSEDPPYAFTPFNPASFIAAQGQVVPLALPNGTKGFGRFPTITEAALILYDKGPLTVSGTVPAGGQIRSGSTVIQTFENETELEDYVIGDVTQSTVVITGTNFTLNSETNQPRQIGAVVILEPFNVSPGPPPWTANVRYAISNLDQFNMGFPSGTLVNLVSSIDSTLNATAQTGLEANLQMPPRAPKTLGPTDANNPDPQFYPFAGSFEVTGTVFDFPGGNIQIDIYQGAVRALNPADLVQSIQMEFPPVNDLPLPQNGVKVVNMSAGTTTIHLPTASHARFSDYNERLSRMVNSNNIGRGRWGIAEDGQHRLLPLVIASTATPYPGDTVRSVEARYAGPTRGDYRMIAGLKNVPAEFFEGHGEKDAVLGGALYATTTPAARVVHSLTIDGMAGGSDTGNSNGFYTGAGNSTDPRGKLVPTANYNDPSRGNNVRNSTRPVAPRGLQGAFMANGAPGDWDNGVGTLPDGPYVNMPDQSNSNKSAASWSLYYEKGGYVNSSGMVESGASFSPNRQIASAVAFGSLPTGLNPSNPSELKPWQTLLFAKNPAAGALHPGFGIPAGPPPYTTPPDHAFLDFFTMPIVEPYAISEPFSTAGKVNMNYQIVPFTYLTRSTGVRAVLKATRLMAIPANAADTYKYTTSTNPPPDFRYTLNPDELTGTLAGFEERFNSGDLFRSASEICGLYLVPGSNVDGTASNATYQTMDTWWNNFQLTGDNVREGPYGHLYPRLTTKSNAFTVHVKAQSISKSAQTTANVFVEGKDQINGEFQGSFLIERYLDPNSDSLVKADGKTVTNELDPDGMVGPYKFRVVHSKKFAP